MREYLTFSLPFCKHVAFTEEYGFSMVISNLIMLLSLSSWFWDVFAQKNSFSASGTALLEILEVPMAFLASGILFNPITFRPDFRSPTCSQILPGSCLMTPVYLAILILYHPQINPVTMRSDMAGIIIALVQRTGKLCHVS